MHVVVHVRPRSMLMPRWPCLDGHAGGHAHACVRSDVGACLDTRSSMHAWQQREVAGLRSLVGRGLYGASMGLLTSLVVRLVQMEELDEDPRGRCGDESRSIRLRLSSGPTSRLQTARGDHPEVEGLRGIESQPRTRTAARHGLASTIGGKAAVSGGSTRSAVLVCAVSAHGASTRAAVVRCPRGT
jgi:hypothetical protein